MASIGERIRKRRQELGISQGDLSRRLGVRQATISDLERGIRHETSTDLARRIAYELGVTLDWLIGPYVEAGQDEETEPEDEPAVLAMGGP